MTGLPKVLLGCPTHEVKEYCLEEFVGGVRSLTYPNLEVIMADNSVSDRYSKLLKAKGLPTIRTKHFPRASRRLIYARNVLRKIALERGFDYFLSLEQDVVPPPDVVERLLAHKKTVIGAIVPTLSRRGELLAMVFMKDFPTQPPPNDVLDFRKRLHVYLMEEIQGKGLVHVSACVMGCLLINRSVLERLVFRFGRYDMDDLNLCFDCFKLGVPIYADCGVVCKHHKMDWEEMGVLL